MTSVRFLPGGGGSGQTHESDVTRGTHVHTLTDYELAMLLHRERLREAEQSRLARLREEQRAKAQRAPRSAGRGTGRRAAVSLTPHVA